MKKIFAIIVIILAALSAYILWQQKNKQITIGILEPLEHRAMDEIVQGFTNGLAKNYHLDYKIKVENAQNDTNLQRAILQKMRDAHYDLIVPIGTMPTQMAVSIIKEQPIVSLAASFTQQERNKLKPCRIAVIHDEIPPEKIVQFIHAMYPQMTNLMLIHSSSDKVFPDVAKAIAAGKQLGIQIGHIMVTSLPELMSSAQALPDSTQGILILKDSLIASGISTLVQVAASKKIPLIASDEGSVEGGAYMALGVKERDIGMEGAQLALQVLEGKSPCDIPIQELSQLSLFVNNNIPTLQNVEKNGLKNIAEKFGYKLEFISHPRPGK